MQGPPFPLPIMSNEGLLLCTVVDSESKLFTSSLTARSESLVALAKISQWVAAAATMYLPSTFNVHSVIYSHSRAHQKANLSSAAVTSLIAGSVLAARTTSVPSLRSSRAKGRIPRTTSAPELSTKITARRYGFALVLKLSIKRLMSSIKNGRWEQS